MRKGNRFFFILLITALLFSRAVFAQQVGDIPLTKRIPVLNKRAFLIIPANAADVAQRSIMSADLNQNQYTRIVLTIDKMRLVILAQDLYKYATGDFFNEVNTSRNTERNINKIVLRKAQAVAIRSTPTAFDSTKDAILINNLLIKTRDNTVFSIGVFINRDAYKHKKEFDKLTARIFESLQIGTRLNTTDGGVKNVNIWGTKKDFVLSVPKNYVVTVDRKYDFQVINFHRYTEFRDTSWVSLLIYTGNYPWKDYERYEFEPDSAKKVAGNFLGEPILWMTFSDDKRNIYLKEQKIPFDNVRENLLVHIGIASDKREYVDELTRIIEKIRLSK